jgi:hypothetical protein
MILLPLIDLPNLGKGNEYAKRNVLENKCFFAAYS